MKKHYWFNNTFKAILAIICASVFITAIVGGIGTKTHIISESSNVPLAKKESMEKESYTANSKQIINVLLIGTDDSKTNLNEDARADSITMISADLEKSTIKMISIERSITVPIEEIDSEDWITHVFRYSGAVGVVKSVEEAFDLNIDKYIRVNFNSYKEIIDTLGGIDLQITLEEAKAIKVIDPSSQPLKAGENHLSGVEALQYARLRSIDNNYERMDRQKNVIKAIVEGAKSGSVAELIQIAARVMPEIETNFTLKEITELITDYSYMLSATMEQITIPDSADIVGGDHTADGRILTKINIPIVKQKLHYYLYNITLELDPEEVAMYKNYKSQYTPLEVWESDPHQDVSDYISLNELDLGQTGEEPLAEAETEKITEAPSVSAPEIKRGSGGADNSSVILPTIKNDTMTNTHENTPTTNSSENTIIYDENNLPLINRKIPQKSIEEPDFRSAANGQTE